MNTVSPVSEPLALRACAALSAAHAVLVTGGLGVVWVVRSATGYQTFARSAEGAWICFLVLWPAWWLVCLLVSRGRWWRPYNLLLGATLIWLMAAIPSLLLLWSLRGFR